MLITNGTKTRNIDPNKLPEYVAKGYTDVKTSDKTKTAKNGKK